MDKELIAKLARDAGLEDIFDNGRFWGSKEAPNVTFSELERFAALVAEECAKLSVARAVDAYARCSGSDPTDIAASVEAEGCAEDIREQFKLEA